MIKEIKIDSNTIYIKIISIIKFINMRLKVLKVKREIKFRFIISPSPALPAS